MTRPKRPDFNPPADLLSRLPKASTPTRDDKLKLLDSIRNHTGNLLAAGVNRTIFNAIERDIRAHKDSAPAVTRAPSRTEERGEAGSSIPVRALERKISEDITVAIGGSAEHSINLYTHGQFLICFTPEQAERAAHALAELAGDLRQDANARAWSQELLATTE